MKENKTALITGATSGIGAAFARQFAARGYDLLLTGRRKEKLTALARELARTHNVKAEPIIADFTDDAAVQKLIVRIQNRDDIGVLVNNAGFGGRGPFVERDINDITDMIRVHVLAAVRLIHAALPRMLAHGRGVIINVSSLGAFTPFPRNGVYGGTKLFLNFFSEALCAELYGKGITIQALCPGFTRTEFHEKLGYNTAALKNRGIIRWMSADKVVAYSVKHLGKKVICVPGFWNRRLKSVYRFIPKRLFYRFSNAFFKDFAVFSPPKQKG
jgi:short-subunit dehydrogenase